MTEFAPEKFDEKYVHYFEKLETAYSNAYDHLHEQCDSETLRAIDRIEHGLCRESGFAD